jgi:hypothetical protein
VQREDVDQAATLATRADRIFPLTQRQVIGDATQNA